MLNYFNIQSVSSGALNPMQSDGQLVYGLNITSGVMVGNGAIAKRPGYKSYLQSLGTQINTLFSFPQNTGTSLFTYAAAGTQLFYSTQGTGNWTQANPGSIANGAYVGNAIMQQGENSGTEFLCIGDGVNQLLTTSDGINFSLPEGGTAPIVQYLAPFHGIMYATDGTSNSLYISSLGDPNNWSDSGTSSATIEYLANYGACEGIFVAANYLIITRQKGNIFTYDDTTFIDTSTIYGPSSPRSIAQIDDYWFYINSFGATGFDGAQKQILSNPIQRQFYNRQGSGITPAAFGTAPSTSWYWYYLTAVGTVTDDFTGRTTPNAILQYDYQNNQWFDWSFANPPTAMHSYYDTNNVRQMIFGDATGQAYQMDMTQRSDNGKPIQTDAVFVFTYDQQSTAFSPTSASALSTAMYEKKWNWIRLFFNPGDEVNVQFAFSNSMSLQRLTWSEAVLVKGRTKGTYWQCSDGVLEMRFPDNENNPRRSRFLFVRIYDYSATSQWQYNGCMLDADPMLVR